MSKVTYYSVKSDLLQCQNRPTTVSKVTNYSVKSDLLQCQKRPTTGSKVTYYNVKRALLQHCLQSLRCDCLQSLGISVSVIV